MADIELVIKIPEEEYKVICKDYIAVHACPFLLGNAIKNGTPLPKGHGVLTDVGEIHSTFKKICDDYNIDNLSFIADMDMNFDLAPTIIEADKAESDHKCHNCKHYTSGERDGSCDSYICKHYSGWEMENEE